jgi:hypothetical protein
MDSDFRDPLGVGSRYPTQADRGPSAPTRPRFGGNQGILEQATNPSSTPGPMTIERIIAAIQRNSHLKRRAMVRTYPELFDVKFELELEALFWEVRSKRNDILGRCLITDGQFAPSDDLPYNT